MNSKTVLAACFGAALAALAGSPAFAGDIKLDGVAGGKISETDCKAKHGAVIKEADGKHCALPPAARAAMQNHPGAPSQPASPTVPKPN